MAKTYDATLKQLVDAFADDWGLFLCERLALPPGCRAEPLDADLSTISPPADKLFRLSDPPGGFIHLELEASWSGALADRALIYNVLARDRYSGPMRSVVVLLRRSADAVNLTGALSLYDENGEYLRFRYRVVKLWELPCEPFLAGPLGTLPLGLLTDDAQPRLATLIHQVDDRLRQEAESIKISSHVWTACNLLLGLRYDSVQVDRFFQGVRGMEESSTYQAMLKKGHDQALAMEESSAYQAILKKGRDQALMEDSSTYQAILQKGRDQALTMEDSSTYQAILKKGRDQALMEASRAYQAILKKGRDQALVEERAATLLCLGVKKFGFRPDIETVLSTIADISRLERMRDRILDAVDWDDLLRTP